MQLRIRSSKGTFSVSSLAASSTYADLTNAIKESTGIDPRYQSIRFGFPPAQLIPKLQSDKLGDLKIQTGEMLIVEESTTPIILPEEKPMVPSSSQRMFEREVISADNSCLFNAVARVLEPASDRGGDKARELRELIAGTVLSDPDTYNEAFLSMSNTAYVQYIMDPAKWGGGIELAILSLHYGVEIASWDIQSMRVDMFGQEHGYPYRCMLVYDGIHFDALVEKLPNGEERTRFLTSDREAMDAARKVLEELNKKKNFTDIANFDLQCGVCYCGVVGQAGAQRHAMETGHQNFQEYRKK